MASTFTNPAKKVVASPDPHKYVNYTLGMLLGVDDFLQEHAYLAGTDHWLTRELLGYGTASGLRVTTDIDKDKGPRVLVDPGVAISPRGQLIRVTPSQCAYLNEWLMANKQQLGDAPNNPLTVYVVLSYRSCASDPVPISGEPCRSEDSLTASSRLSDDFTLELRLNAPDQREEEALQGLVAWLREVQIADPQITSDKDFTTLEQFVEALRTAAKNSDPTSPSTFMKNSPPTDMEISADEACEYWQTALRIWTTELRPNWRAKSSDGDVPDEDSLLLAELTVPLKETINGDWQVDTDTNPVNINEQNRPRLLHLRLLQEWMLCGRRETPPSDIVLGEVRFGQEPDEGSLNCYSRGDHTHGTPDLVGDVTSNDDGSVTVQGLRNIPIDPTPPGDGQVLMYNAAQNIWQPVDLEADDEDDEDDEDEDGGDEDKGNDDDSNGDVTKNDDGSTTVQGLQNIPIADTTPAPGQVLMFTGEQWQPIDMPSPTTIASAMNFVEHPQDQGRYRIAAAGLIRCDGSSQQPSYNNLVAQSRQDGYVILHFNNYQWPNEAPYVVKALPVWNDRINPCIVHFDRFQPNFFALRVTDGSGNPASQEDLLQLELIVEVSQYVVSVPLQANVISDDTQIGSASSRRRGR